MERKPTRHPCLLPASSPHRVLALVWVFWRAGVLACWPAGSQGLGAAFSSGVSTVNTVLSTSRIGESNPACQEKINRLGVLTQTLRQVCNDRSDSLNYKSRPQIALPGDSTNWHVMVGSRRWAKRTNLGLHLPGHHATQVASSPSRQAQKTWK